MVSIAVFAEAGMQLGVVGVIIGLIYGRSIQRA